MWQKLPANEYASALGHLTAWAAIGCEWRGSDYDELTFAAMLNGAIRALVALRGEAQPARNVYDVYADLIEAFRADLITSTKETRLARSRLGRELREHVDRYQIAHIVTHAKSDARKIFEFERKKQHA